MEEPRSRYQATVAPNGRIESLRESLAGGVLRPIDPASAEGIAVLGCAREIEYRFGEGERLRDLPYLEVLAAMRQEILLTAHKVRHGELLDEPEVLPALRRLLAEVDAAAASFRRAAQAVQTDS